MKFELETFNRNTKDEDLIDDLKKSYKLLSNQGISFTYRSYDKIGKYSAVNISTRFGSWNNALKSAKITPTLKMNISNEELFLNLQDVWIAMGRQPVSRDMVKPLSRFSNSVYSDRFGTWRKALNEFVEYISQNDTDFVSQDYKSEQNNQIESRVIKHKTSRNISDRMRFRILSRDGFTCQSCGASPIKERGVELHVDHIKPWSKGGETIEENLQTKCKQCNLGKGNAFDT